MRISEFSIRRYGPLPDTGKVQLGDFSVLYGKNEYGKTLTIDALVKLTLQKGRTLFERIGRVDEEPDGYVIIDDLQGKSVKMPEKGDLTSLLELTPEQSRNIFVIRNSDLSIAAETEFYRNVIDRLTGLRTDEITSIKSQLQDIGKLTRADSTGSIRDWAGEKLKTRTKNAEKLIERLEKLGNQVTEEGLDDLEENLVKVKAQANDTERKIHSFEDARKRDKYEKGNKACQDAKLANQELKGLAVFTDEEVGLWAGSEKEISDLSKEHSRLEQEVAGKKVDHTKQIEELDEDTLSFQSLTERKKKFDDEVRPEVKNYELKIAEFKNKEGKDKFSTIAAAISAAILAISAIGIIVKPSLFLYVLGVLSLISTVVFSVLKFSVVREKASLSEMFEKIRLASSRFGINQHTVEEILLGIQEFDEVYEKKQRELEQKRTTVSVLGNGLKRIEEIDLINLEKRIEEARTKIDGIIQKTGLRKLSDYREKLRLKVEFLRSLDTQIGILKSHFGSVGDQLEDNLPHWLREIQSLKEFENKATDISFDEKSVAQLTTDLDKFRSEAQQLEQKITGFHEGLREIERETNDILQLEGDYLYCSSLADIRAIKDKLGNFIGQIDQNKELALAAIGIFEELGKEEEGKISSLFGKDSSISKHFSEITGNLYEEVQFVVDDVRKVQIKQKNGITIDADKLSGGAYDQLYLSIRLAIGEKLLKGKFGFFIMDDPFIKADGERLARQLSMLKRICKAGWQVIYFTAKDEVIQLLKSDIDEGTVSYINLESTIA